MPLCARQAQARLVQPLPCRLLLIASVEVSGNSVIAENLIHACQDAGWYSLSTPPALRILRARKVSRSVTFGGSGLSGTAADRPM